MIDRAAVLAAAVPEPRPAVPVDRRAEALLAEAFPADAGDGLRQVLTVRTSDLIGYQNQGYARRYAEDVRAVAATARERAGEHAGERIAVAYAKGLHKLMAYKDEYEVARLHLDPAERDRVRAEFGRGAQVSVLLHPPVLRALGMKRKIRLRRTAPAAFRLLRAARGLRGTAFDPFGHDRVRRTERALVEEYRALVRDALAALTPDNADAVEAIAGLPETIRGYEDIKLARVADFRAEARTALAELAASPAASALRSG